MIAELIVVAIIIALNLAIWIPAIKKHDEELARKEKYKEIYDYWENNKREGE